MRKFRRIQASVIPTHAHFDSHRHRHGLHRCRNQARGQGQITHQRRAGVAINNLFNRAPHVDVDNGRTAFFIQLGRLAHFIRGATGKLHRHGLLNGVPFAFLDALPRLTDHRLAGDHLGDVQAGAKLTHNFAERHIGHASHRRQYDGTINFDVADMDGFQLHLQTLPKI